MLGICIRWNRARGFGFIVTDDPTRPDYFLHCSDIQAPSGWRYLNPGDRVTFEPKGEHTDKPRATNVRKLSNAVEAVPVAGESHE